MADFPIALLDEAVSILEQGGVGAFPTDTLYALGAKASIVKAVERVYIIKGRPFNNPLPLLIPDAAAISEIAQEVPSLALELAERFWPGPLTLVLKKKPGHFNLAAGGGKTVALRVPDHPWALYLLRRIEAPLTGTSANLSGGPAPATAEEVRLQIGDKLDFLLDGGPCPLGKESTILDITKIPPLLVREGAILRKALEEVCGRIQ